MEPEEVMDLHQSQKQNQRLRFCQNPCWRPSTVWFLSTEGGRTRDLTVQVFQCGQKHEQMCLRCPVGLTCEQVELVVELQQLEGAPRSPALLFGQTVVNVSLVFGGATHPDL